MFGFEEVAINRLDKLSPLFVRIDGENPVVRDSVLPQEVKKADQSALQDGIRVRFVTLALGRKAELTIPTGPKPIEAMFNTSPGAIVDFPTGSPRTRVG